MSRPGSGPRHAPELIARSADVSRESLAQARRVARMQIATIRDCLASYERTRADQQRERMKLCESISYCAGKLDYWRHEVHEEARLLRDLRSIINTGG